MSNVITEIAVRKDSIVVVRGELRFAWSATLNPQLVDVYRTAHAYEAGVPFDTIQAQDGRDNLTVQDVAATAQRWIDAQPDRP
jgi:hypothetical protein